MWCLRILPAVYAMRVCPFSSVTRYLESGRTSSTLPRISMSSSLAKLISLLERERQRVRAAMALEPFTAVDSRVAQGAFAALKNWGEAHDAIVRAGAMSAANRDSGLKFTKGVGFCKRRNQEAA